jgi:hypothetical protein
LRVITRLFNLVLFFLNDVHINIVLNKFIGIYKQPIAGDFLSEQLLQQLQRLEINVAPHYMIAKKTVVDPDQPANVEYRERPNTTNSYHKYMQMVSLMQNYLMM